ncbi:LINE-1 retrotransposable element ORF2 protein [Chlorella vulgaris]
MWTLHALQDYCNAKKLTVNAKKTQVMIMRPGGGSGNGKLAAGESFAYAGLPLEVASSTKYLGLTFSQLSKQHGFASCADVLAKAGRQAMFAVRRRAWELGACLVEQQCMLFDVFVNVERQRVQGLPKQVTAAISLAELGRQPLQSFWIQQLVRFWNRLQNSAADEDRVLGWAFKDNLELMREGGDLAAGSACWSRRWLHVLQSAPPASGTLEWLTELDEAAVIERAAAAYLRKCLEPKTRPLPKTPAQDPPPPAASCTNKFAYYMHHIRPNLPLCQPAPHLYEVYDSQARTALSRFRTSCHDLRIEPTNPATCHSTPLSTASSELDSDISVADVHAALDKLSSSSACLGPLKAVLIKAGRDALTPVLAALFNAVFRSGCFPPEWSLGAITPIHKKGDTADPNNYRGITVGHILGKLYALAINTRLNTWLETQGLRARGQAGFRQGYRTVDNCFILRALAERARSRGVKLYLCAVDFEKAFDSVDRPLLWAALQRAGIGGTMLQAIQAMYADVPVCVRTEEGLSGCFQSVLGVKQGCPLSPLLFGIFLDDFEGHIQQLGDAAALPQLAGRTVPPLLFADDMFLLSSSASGLQAQLHALQDYCNAKKLTVNAKKTQVMIMRPGGGSGNGKLAAGESFAYAGLPLEVASSTKYLGLTFSQLSKQHGFASCADVLAKAGRQAMFAVRRRAWELGACLVEQQCMLFDVFVKPVLSYGCELWGVDALLRPDCSSVERVHRWFCRRVQGLPKQVTAAISLAELGRQPLQSFWIQQLVRFWNRLQNSAADEDRVLGWAFKDNLELMREGGDLAAGSACWSRRWLHVLQSAPPASGTLEWLTELDEAAVIERAAAAYLRKCLEPKTRPLPKTPAQDPPPPAASCTNKFAYYMHHIRPNLPLCQPAPHLYEVYDSQARTALSRFRTTTSNPTTSHPTAAISSCSPSAATVPSSSQPTTAPPATNPATCHSTPLSTASSELDSDISVADVHAALDKLSSSSACLGPLKAVLIKAGRDALTPVLAALFNAVFRSGCFPPEWSLGAITPIHKKGDTADPNNYRGITVGHILGKLYKGCRWRRRVLSGGLGQRTCLRFQALAKGCPLSPLLFGIFLDDFEGHIQQLGDAAALPQLAGRTVPPLLFADDMFLLSSSASGLQAQLHALQDYCNAKKLTVNAKKTQRMKAGTCRQQTTEGVHSELAVERGVEWHVAGLVAGGAVVGWEEEGTVAADGEQEEMAAVGWLVVGLEVAGTAVVKVKVTERIRSQRGSYTRFGGVRHGSR